MRLIQAKMTLEWTKEALVSLVDMTRLDEFSNVELDDMLQQAQKYRPACICIPLDKVKRARAQDSRLIIATVINFPGGTDSAARSIEEINKAVEDGADELDIVFPWRAYLGGGQVDVSREFMSTVIRHAKSLKTHNGQVPLVKTILETGGLKSKDAIKDAACIVIEAGSDYVKTSTGFTEIGCTKEAVSALLDVLAEHRNIGLKLSGGIGTKEQALDYVNQVETRLGRDFIDPSRFRIGSSKLVQAIMNT